MGYYKQFKNNLRDKVKTILEDWISDQEKPDGNKAWDRFDSVNQAAAEFSAHLHDSTVEQELNTKERLFRVSYQDNSKARQENISCLTSQHARILFHRQHEGCTITSIEDITDKTKE